MQREFTDLQDELNSTNQQASKMTNYLKELETDNENLIVEIEKLRKKNQEKDSENLEKTKYISSMKTELSELQSQLYSSTKSNELKFLKAKFSSE